jgi:hypothetical protein
VIQIIRPEAPYMKNKNKKIIYDKRSERKRMPSPN